MSKSQLLNKKRLDKDINKILELITNSFEGSLISIILYGSYGRDEGSFYVSNGDIKVYNDYDILLVVKKKIPSNLLELVKKNLLDCLDIRFIDLSQKPVKKLKYLKPLIFNYDLKYGSSVIWGDLNILKKIPNFSPSQLTLEDAEILYFTRIYTFFGSIDEKGLNEGVCGEKSRFFRNQMAKAILAIVDVMLLQKKSYHTSYNERIRRFKNLYPKENKLIELSDWALREKLSPSDERVKPSKIKIFYNDILNSYHEVMFKALSQYYKKNIKNSDDLRKAISCSKQNFLLLFKTLLIEKNLKGFWRQKNIRLAQSYALEYLLGKENSSYALKKSKLLLMKIDSGLKDKDIHKDSLRELIVKYSR
tara:strand:- start:33213 stop:34301 length:1089 start_codon:yes stop_codon:yes gene_type:complete